MRSDAHIVIILALLGILSSLFIPGCTSDKPATKDRWGVVLLLDNNGGFAHGGRRLILRWYESFTDIRYTDVIGDKRITNGRYFLNEHSLTLTYNSGEKEILHRVDYDGKKYWVADKDRMRVVQPDETSFRELSLREITE